MSEFFSKIFLGNTLLQYLWTLLLILGGFLAIRLIIYWVLRHLQRIAKKTTTTLDDFIVGVLKKIGLPLAYVGVIYLGLNTLNLSPSLKKVLDIVGMSILVIYSARFLVMLVVYGFEVYSKSKGQDITLERSLRGMLKVVKVIIWGLALIFFLDNMGFKISTVIAGLGIGGVAVALAAQTILKDLFSYFSIIFDRPFEVGDFVIIDEYLGTVEYIGIKTTRIRSLSGEQLIFSNTDLTDSRVRNYKRMQKRRVVFRLGVVYSTPLEKLKQIPVIIEDVIKNVKDTIFDRAHFFSYGDFSLIFEVVYYVLGSDYNKYMDIQQEINLAIKEEFEKRNIEFAFPTQTLYLIKSN